MNNSYNGLNISSFIHFNIDE